MPYGLLVNMVTLWPYTPPLRCSEDDDDDVVMATQFCPGKILIHLFYKQTLLIGPLGQRIHCEIPVSIILYNFSRLIQPQKQVTYVHVSVGNFVAMY